MKIAHYVFFLFCIIGCNSKTISRDAKKNDEEQVIKGRLDITHKKMKLILRPNTLRSESLKFDVILLNSSEDLKIWESSCSFGYSMLSFELISEKNKKTAIYKEDIEWTKNTLSYFILKKNNSFIYKIDLNDGTWVLPPLDKSTVYKVVAKFRSDSSSEAEEHNVWSGVISSDEIYESD